MDSGERLAPSYVGHIATARDALILFEACLTGHITHIARRPHDRERPGLIQSGNVFIYEENTSGIKRWTDGVPWSPSRVLVNLLVYRELERPFPPGQKKRALKRNKTNIGKQENGGPSKERTRSLIGSLVDSYGFKENGLVKKTLAVTVGGVTHHLVSYYTVADVMNGKFITPSKDPNLQGITPRYDLIHSQGFKDPIDGVPKEDERSDYPEHNPIPRTGYELTNQTITHRPMNLPTPATPYGQTQVNHVFSSYGSITSVSGPYDALQSNMTPTGFGQPFAPPPASAYSMPRSEDYDMNSYRPQRYNSVIGIGDTNRTQMPMGNPQFVRRISNFDPCQVESSSFNGTGSPVNVKSEPSYSSSQAFYQREAGIPPQHNYGPYGPPRSLPTPGPQSAYDRTLPSTYTSERDALWSFGNVVQPQFHGQHQHWANSGT